MLDSSTAQNPFAPEAHAAVVTMNGFLGLKHEAQQSFPLTLRRSPFFTGYVVGALDALAHHLRIPDDCFQHVVDLALDRLLPEVPLAQALQTRAGTLSHFAGQACGASSMRRYLAGGPVHRVLDYLSPSEAAPRTGPRAHVAAIAQAMKRAGHGPGEFRQAFPIAFARQLGRAFDAGDARDMAMAEAAMFVLSLSAEIGNAR